MTEERYETMKEMLPDWVAGRLNDEQAARVERAVEADGELAAEARVLERLARARPEPPEGLAARISEAVREDRRPGAVTAAARGGRSSFSVRPSRWALAAAAAAVLMLGALELVERRSTVPTEGGPLDRVALEEAPSPWMTGEGPGTGAPVLLDDLSDEALSSLLEEMGG